MKKKEIVIIVGIVIVALIGLLVVKNYNDKLTYDKQTVIVKVSNQEVLRFDPNINETYEIQGAYGIMHVEVLDGRWHVLDVECPNHTCEKMGWSSMANYINIICLPNQISIEVAN